MSSKRGTNGTNLLLDERREINPMRRWFVVNTAPGRETACALDCVGNGVMVWLPHFRAVTVRRRRRVETDGLFFPGYLFAGIPVGIVADNLRSREHVRDVLGDPEPLSIPTGIVQALADRLTGDVRSERLSVAAAFRVGEMRFVETGPFAGFRAKIVKILATGRVEVEIAMFGQSTPVELEPKFLAAA